MKMHLSNRFFAILLLLIILISAISSCSPGGPDYSGLATVGAAIQREKLNFSVLEINIHGTGEDWDYPISWQDRYSRIADWMTTTGKRPDIIALQEVPGVGAWPIGNLNYYEALFTLVSQINERTGASYRIAYLIVNKDEKIPLIRSWAGNALLYNADRVQNNTPTGNFESLDYDNEFIGYHLRKSLPCLNQSPQFLDMCSLIDGDGLAWISSYRPTDGGWDKGTVFTRFQLKDVTDLYIHIYNVHVQWDRPTPPPDKCCSYQAYMDSHNNLFSKIQTDFGNNLLYPPIILGDFNLGANDLPSHFPNFDFAGWDKDVTGVIIGKQANFPSNNHAYVIENLIVPEDYWDRTLKFCGHAENFWSDHCGVFVQFSPLP
jgi:hypothetical protein